MIDWFTVAAQIINFLILVALLKYFLYGRIMDAIADRERQLTEQWDAAKQQRAEAAGELDEARQKNAELDQQREQMMAEIHDDVENFRQQLVARVRAEVAEQESLWTEAIADETEGFLRDLRQRTSESVCNIARRALADLADASLERQIVSEFLKRLDSLSDPDRSAVNDSLAEDQTAVVATTWELPEDLQTRVTDALRAQFTAAEQIEFEQSADLLCGIAVRTDAHTLGWSLRDYLMSLEQDLRTMLDEEVSARQLKAREVAAVDAAVDAGVES